MGATAQAVVPGVYAWGVTVAPSAWTSGAHSPARLAKIAAIVALLALGVGVPAERRWGERARIACLWAFVLACAVTWTAAPRSLSAFRVDAPRGLAGMLAWALFAFASYAPARPGHGHPRNAPKPSLNTRPLDADVVYLAIGALLAALLEVVGWATEGAERALLVRFVALAAGLAIIGTAAEIALARHGVSTQPRRSRLRRAAAPLVLLGLLALL